MKRWLWIMAVLGVLGVIVHGSSRGQAPITKPPAEVGPGEGGATLRLPGSEPAAPAPNPGGKTPALPYYLQKSDKTPPSPYPALSSSGTRIALPPSNSVDKNKDIEITAEAGQWMIFVMAYSGPNAPEMARKFVMELRDTYKLKAYVFNYGAEEKRKEFERVQKIRQEQIDELEKAGLKDYVPIRVSTMRIDEQTGVLVGGYKSFDEAALAVKKIRTLNAEPLKGKVDLDIVEVQEEIYDKSTKKVSVTSKGKAYNNPFLKAFPARNPAVAKEQHASTSEDDLKFLRQVNREEPLTLFNCKKPFTLVVKQFNMQHKMLGNSKEDAREASGFLDSFRKGFLSFGARKNWQDNAAHNAHNLAEAFRKSGLPEAYVLHSKYCSYVTVGGYDSLEDPRLVAMQNLLESRFKMEDYRPLELFPRPVPMQVPGVAMK